MKGGKSTILNAGETVRSVEQVQALACAVTLVRRHFPAATPNLRPWRDDAQTRQWSEPESIDLAFHFPGWSPRLQCRSLLIQLRLSSDDQERQGHLLGVLMRGMTYEGERWRLATVGDWQPAGSHLPQPDQVKQLREICQDLFELFPTDATNGTVP